ncbi:choloylglycine hydrolase family protein [Synechococcus sp. CCY9201]|uniref:choloylglycine hydrolase family protein n=1 Tax=unclassified Synechococcus TaxID=2626047 RepID=UPI002AD372D4|nr:MULTISPECIES: choloylglycine hydrolase family protein [unclassified Synechococcus]MEA5424189.1 choloylglycine hydrolase family protein [Synechococcus sp. CCY9202]MEA5473999.1 choloylglycine hydrolase family protein [Synechococcus sp. CCY9201]CAK6698111.1 Penicillin acylase [Synechococcus sp. CBW1107]
MSIAKRVLAALAAVGIAGWGAHSARACTSFTLQGNDGGRLYGRTMEFGQPLNSNAVLIQRGTAIQGNGPDGKSGGGLQWTSRYAVVGLNALGLKDVVPDGMNEKGLAGGLLYFAGYAKFQNVPQGQARRSINSSQLLTYVLTNFATVAEVEQGLPKILVNGATVPAFGGPLPIHMTVHDRTGRSLSVEYIDGRLTMLDNPTGVYTNDPPLPYHLAAAGNYANLSAMPPAEMIVNGLKLPPASTGGGLHGLPGDFLATSRFIRALTFSRFAPRNLTTEEQVGTAFRILGQFDLPPGSILLPPGGAFGGGGSKTTYEITEWSIVADQKNLVYYIQTYDNPGLRSLNFDRLPLDGGQIKVMTLDQPAEVTVLQP